MGDQRRRSSRNDASRAASARQPDELPGERELIVISKQDVGLRARSDGVASAAGADVSPLAKLLDKEGVRMRPLFGASEERLQHETDRIAAETGRAAPELATFYRVDAPDDRLDDLAEALAEQDVVEAAYVKPPAVPAMWDMTVPPADEAPPLNTPNFILRQGYLNAAPEGVDARFAWTVPGGKGQNIRVIDIEGAWRFSHEDLTQNQGGVVGGTPTADLAWRNHGTAVIGEIGGDENDFGITGICPVANVRAVSIFGGLGSAGALRHAADRLSAGDIILIELHRPGPRFNFTSPNGQQGYIAIEFWPDDFEAIRYAVTKGILVVEAAGNGAENLDDAIYNARPAGFPANWTNPFNRANRDSGAIIVGAGAPPPGTHGRDHGPDRSRLDFSNYGACVDAQGWGREVTTAGGRQYSAGELQGGANEDEWYTDTFSGTSSASPIVVGSLGCVQGVLRARSLPLLTPATARNLLRSTGSPQQDAPGRPRTQRIGNRPDCRAMITRLSPTLTAQNVPLFRYWNATIADHFYTTNWSELGTGRYGYRYEGVQCYVSRTAVTGLIPLYRYWNPTNTDHFYTTDATELGTGRYGYQYEGVQCYVPAGQAAGTAALLRYWNPTAGDHFYTTSFAELGYGRYGYRYERVQCFVYTQAAIPAPAPPLFAGTPTWQPLHTEPREPAGTMEPVLIGAGSGGGEWEPTGSAYGNGPEFGSISGATLLSGSSSTLASGAIESKISAAGSEGFTGENGSSFLTGSPRGENGAESSFLTSQDTQQDLASFISSGDPSRTVSITINVAGQRTGRAVTT